MREFTVSFGVRLHPRNPMATPLIDNNIYVITTQIKNGGKWSVIAVWCFAQRSTLISYLNVGVLHAGKSIIESTAVFT